VGAGIIALAAIAVYHNSFQGPLIFDDQTWIASNPTIRRLWPLGPVFFPPKSAVVGGRPVLNLTLAINYAVGGTNVWGYHFVNLAIHILAALTLLGVVRRTLLLPKLRDRFGSAATAIALSVAILWTLHPLQTSAVTYLTQRNESLMALFYLLTLYGVIRGATAAAGLRTGIWHATAVAACLLGMLTKETMATAPLVVLLYDRTFLAGTFGEALRRRWGLYAAMLATWGALAWCLISTDFHSGTAGFGVKHFTPWTYLLTQPGVIAHYLEQSFWPAGLSLDYGWPPAATVREIVPAGLLIVGLLGLTGWALVKRPMLGFLAASFFLILGPTSSFIPIDDAAFDHRMYLPLAAVIVLTVMAGRAIGKRWLGCWLPPQWNRQRLFPWIAAIAVVGAPTIALSWATIKRNELFESELAIWQDASAKRPNNARALDQVGSALKTLGQTTEAVDYYHRAMDADPKYVLPVNNLAGLYEELGDRSAAVALYRRALDIEPDQPWVNINLASVLARQGKLDEAVARCQAGLDRKHEFPEALVVLADVRLRQGRITDAERFCRDALKLNPDLPEAHAKLAAILMLEKKPAEAVEQLRQGADATPRDAAARDRLAVALAMQNRNDEAVAEFRVALSAAPNAWVVHFHFGYVLARQGQWAAAISHLREAVRLQPDEPAPVKKLAWVLATCPEASVRNGPESVQLAERAMKLSRAADPEGLDTLAAAQAEIGRFDEAAKTAEEAMFLATRQNNHGLATRIADRLSLYLTRTPYRETEPSGP